MEEHIYLIFIIWMEAAATSHFFFILFQCIHVKCTVHFPSIYLKWEQVHCVAGLSSPPQGTQTGEQQIRQLLHKSGRIFVLFFKNNSHYRYYRYPIQSEVIWEVLLKSSPTEGFILIKTNRKFDKIHFSLAIQFYVLKWFEEFKNLINWLN